MLKSRLGQCHRTTAACLRSNQSPPRLCQLLPWPADCPNRGRSASANQRPPIGQSSHSRANTCSAYSTLQRRPYLRTGAWSRGGRGTSWPAPLGCRETPPGSRRRGHSSSPAPQDRRACREGVWGCEKTSLRSGEGPPAWWQIQRSSDLSCFSRTSSSEHLGALGGLQRIPVTMPRLYRKSALLALFYTRQNELTPNQMNETVKHTASTSRPGPAAWPDWYFPYSRMPARAPMPAIARKVNPVTSSQSWCSPRPKEGAIARVPASTARPLRLRCTMLEAV